MLTRFVLSTVVITTVLALGVATPLQAALFSGTSSNGAVSASAEITISTDVSGNHLLTVVLTNTSAPLATANNGQVVTGVTWGFNPNLSGTLSLFPDSSHNPTLTNATDHIWVVTGSSKGQTTYAINDSTPLGGTWTNKTNDSKFAAAGLGDYGYATTGASGLFAAGTIVGSAPGSANYGLVSDATYGPGSPDTMPNGTGPESLPLVQNSITIQFKYTGNLTYFTESSINEVHFLIGTSGANFAGVSGDNQTAEVPEPASLGLWGIGLAIAGFISRRRLRVD